ncbi:MAG: hypothetical protein Q8K02_04250, partial [Flavobacterium sp.]|nr:hypothetical protein [Flavobacterium sp.]
FLFLFYSLDAQNEKLNGVWILDKIFYKNGNPLEINHTMYSEFLEYEFINNKLKITLGLYSNANVFDVIINDEKITNQYRDINYEFIDDKLMLNDVGDEKMMLFIRKNKFIDTYPEFKLSKILYRDKEVYIPNYFIKPKFNYVGDIDDFLRKKIPTLSSRNHVGDLEFKFILTSESKIEDIEIINNTSKELDNELKVSLNQAEKLYKNDTGKDLLIVKSYRFLSLLDKPNKIEKKINKLIIDGHNFYKDNDFKKSIMVYKEAIELKLLEEKNTKNINLYYVYNYLGISYLAENEIELACECFRKNGNKTNFNIRNYLINFCE